MHKISVLLLFLFFYASSAFSQSSYESRIEKLANDLATTFTEGKNTKIGLGTFLFDDNHTKFTEQLYDDLSAELAALNANQSRFVLINNVNLMTINGYTDAITETDKAQLIRKEKNIDYVIFGKLSENETGFKLQLRVYETRDGNLVNAFKCLIDKTKEFETLNSQILEVRSLQRYTQLPVTAPELISNKTTQIDTITKEKPQEEKKPKKKRENKFFKALGDMALTSMSTSVNSYLDKKINQNTTTPTQTQQTSQTNSGSQSTGLDNTTSTTGGTTNPNYSLPAVNNNSSGNEPCNAYINLINKTQNTITVSIYKENPVGSYGTRAVFTLTIAATKSKKLHIEKDLLYYYTAVNDNSASVLGFGTGNREINGTFQVEKCNEAADEEIE